MCLEHKHPLVSNSILTDETWESVAYLVMSELFLTRISEQCGLKLGSQRLRKSSKSVFQLISKLHLVLCSSRYHSQLLKTFFDFKQDNFWPNIAFSIIPWLHKSQSSPSKVRGVMGGVRLFGIGSGSDRIGWQIFLFKTVLMPSHAG